MFRNSRFIHSGAVVLLAALSSSLYAAEPVMFRVSIESVTRDDTLTLPDATRTKAPISPGLYLVTRDRSALFKPGQKASGTPLERLAEDGNAEPLIDALNAAKGAPTVMPFMHNEDFTITATPGDRLQFAVMFVQSNDLFYAPRQGGIALFNGLGHPVSGDRTAELVLWDAGTEVNEAPGAGANQAPRQAQPNTGPDENGVIHAVKGAFKYPAPGNVIRVTITPLGSK